MEERGAIHPKRLEISERRDVAPSSVYGPVFSWRYGESLGVDLLLRQSTCSFHCVYCQLGEIKLETLERAVYVPTAAVLRDLLASDWEPADVITFSGSGEPTLAANLGDAIRALHAETRKPTVVLTNGSMLMHESVRNDLAAADHVSCKLDACSEELFQKINRPVEGVRLSDVVEGLRLLRQQFDGTLSLQTMVLPNNEREATAFVDLLNEIRPDEVHLNVPSRPRPAHWFVEARGAHRAFLHAHAFRTVPREDVQKFAAELHTRTRIRVMTPPHTTVTELPRGASRRDPSTEEKP